MATNDYDSYRAVVWEPSSGTFLDVQHHERTERESLPEPVAVQSVVDCWDDEYSGGRVQPVHDDDVAS